MDKIIVLCVDDEIGILKSLERCLHLEGYEVVQALSGEEGLRRLEERGGHVDAIIADQRMPNMAGDEFLRHVRERFGRIPSIILSGYADIEDMQNRQDLFQLVAKPWDNHKLLHAVASLVQGARRRDPQ